MSVILSVDTPNEVKFCSFLACALTVRATYTFFLCIGYTFGRLYIANLVTDFRDCLELVNNKISIGKSVAFGGESWTYCFLWRFEECIFCVWTETRRVVAAAFGRQYNRLRSSLCFVVWGHLDSIVWSNVYRTRPNFWCAYHICNINWCHWFPLYIFLYATRPSDSKVWSIRQFVQANNLRNPRDFNVNWRLWIPRGAVVLHRIVNLKKSC